ncbi:unnamed protein product [Schistocephalus solidus]|uniref:IRS-type PTB domain-containing protein n=1 Tax=Schistocephalus solidus TaxID=70667 RepID=A0A183SWL4_SCHSO|nr:unnamed protein product [Schistocephalus solidus]
MKGRSGFVSCALHGFLKNDICPLFNPSAPKRILRSVRDTPLPKRVILSYSSKELKIINGVVVAFPSAALQGYYKIEDPRKVLAVCLAGSRISQPGYLVLGFSEENERQKLVDALNRLCDRQKRGAGLKRPAEHNSERGVVQKHLPRVNLAPSEHSEITSCCSETINRNACLPSSRAKQIVVGINRKAQADNSGRKNEFKFRDTQEEHSEDEVKEYPRCIQEKNQKTIGSDRTLGPRKMVQPYSQTLFKRFLEREQPLASLHIECDTLIVYKPKMVL